ncbi:hypothetical protein HZC35_03490 [Candidatus Saganbacteria bacterium]|nr:hypothetical protein [Candidatus Saganbacteria bacterium]
MTEGISGSYSTAYSYYYPSNNGQMCYVEEQYYTPQPPQRSDAPTSPIRVDFSQTEETSPPPSLAQGTLGGAFSFTSAACDCHGITLLGDEDAYDFVDVEIETPVDADGDSLPDLSDEVPMDIGTESDEVDSETTECEWGLLGDPVRVTDNINRAEESIPFVWTGSEYGVSWGNNSETNPEIYFTRLDNMGDKIGVDISVSRVSDIHPAPASLIWTGSEYGLFVTYPDRFLVRLDGEGDSSPRMPSQTTIVWSGSEYGFTWNDSRSPDSYGIYFGRLDSEGNLIGENTRVASTYSYHPSLAWTGSGYGVCWADERDSLGDPEIYFARLDREGNKIADDVRVTNAPRQSYNPNIVWTGSEYAIVWGDTRVGMGAEYAEIYFTRLDNLGNKIGEDIRLTNDTVPVLSWGGNLSWTGHDYGFVWNDIVDIDTVGLHFERLDNSGNGLESDLLISSFPGGTSRASLSWTGTEFGMIWREENNLYFNRVGCVSGGSAD